MKKVSDMTLEDWGVLLGSIFVLFLISCGAFLIVDSWGLPEEKNVAVVRGKHYQPPSSTPGQGGVRHHNPAAYVLELEVVGQEADAKVPFDLYQSVAASQTVTATFTRGRISGSVRVVSVRQE